MLLPNAQKALVIICVLAASLTGTFALGWHAKANSVAATQLELIAERDALQDKLNLQDMRLAEAQRAAHERKDKVVIQYETKWRDAPPATKQSCVDSGLFEYADSILGVSPNGATDKTK